MFLVLLVFQSCLFPRFSDELTVAPAGFVDKCVQLRETAALRRGVMLVGPAGSGKTKVRHSTALVATLQNMAMIFALQSGVSVSLLCASATRCWVQR